MGSVRDWFTFWSQILGVIRETADVWHSSGFTFQPLTVMLGSDLFTLTSLLSDRHSPGSESILESQNLGGVCRTRPHSNQFKQNQSVRTLVCITRAEVNTTVFSVSVILQFFVFFFINIWSGE